MVALVGPERVRQKHPPQLGSDASILPTGPAMFMLTAGITRRTRRRTRWGRLLRGPTASARFSNSSILLPGRLSGWKRERCRCRSWLQGRLRGRRSPAGPRGLPGAGRTLGLRDKAAGRIPAQDFRRGQLAALRPSLRANDSPGRRSLAGPTNPRANLEFGNNGEKRAAVWLPRAGRRAGASDFLHGELHSAGRGKAVCDRTIRMPRTGRIVP